MFLLSKITVHNFSRFRYAEPIMNDTGHISWLIEYNCIINVSDLKTFLQSFRKSFEEKIECNVHHISYNFKDRISLIISPKIVKQNIRPKGVKVEVKRPFRPGFGFIASSKKTSGIGFVASSMKTLDAEIKTIKKKRGAGSKQKATERYIERAKSHKIESERLSVTITSQKGMIPKQVDPQERVVSTKVDLQTTLVDKPILEKATPIDMKSVISRLTSTSDTYARSRFNDSRIYSMARTYIAYLSHQDICVSYEGDTRVSLGLKLKSEGLPLGTELTNLWYEFGRNRGLEDDEIKADLLTYQAYCKTSRVMRLQRACELTRKWLGLKGGHSYTLPPSSVKGRVDRNDNRRTVILELDDVQIEQFS